MLYAIKNDEGEWQTGEALWSSIGDAEVYGTREDAEQDARNFGGHVVELVEAPAKVVVSKEEAKMLEQAKKNGYPAEVIDAYNDMRPDEDRLMRAYVNGWTVEKPKRYVLPMPGTDYHNNQMHGNAQYYAVKGTGNWRPDAIALSTDDAVKHGYTVTQSDIDAAPDWVKAITPVEVTDNDD
ncbi:DUF1642 domain-containing protein [Lacticaseibacillus nasuensis]|nr:DUF1642 domain-containing protein [Lacticaseibacillus nasuensis]